MIRSRKKDLDTEKGSGYGKRIWIRKKDPDTENQIWIPRVDPDPGKGPVLYRIIGNSDKWFRFLKGSSS